jgi:hypothetical protein
MEPPKGDTVVKTEVPVKDPSLSVVDSKTKGVEDANTEIALSDEVEIETKGSDSTPVKAPSRTSSGSKKSVHWSPELVSGSQEPDQKAASSSSAGSNPYIARSPAETSDASLKGKSVVIVAVRIEIVYCSLIYLFVDLSLCL